MAVQSSWKRRRTDGDTDVSGHETSRVEDTPVAAEGQKRRGLEAEADDIFYFHFSYEGKGNHIIEDAASCAEYLSKIRGSERFALPPVNKLVESDAYLKFAALKQSLAHTKEDLALAAGEKMSLELENER